MNSSVSSTSRSAITSVYPQYNSQPKVRVPADHDALSDVDSERDSDELPEYEADSLVLGDVLGERLSLADSDVLSVGAAPGVSSSAHVTST